MSSQHSNLTALSILERLNNPILYHFHAFSPFPQLILLSLLHWLYSLLNSRVLISKTQCWILICYSLYAFIKRLYSYLCLWHFYYDSSQIYISSTDITPELELYAPSCLLDISIWISHSKIKLIGPNFDSPFSFTVTPLKTLPMPASQEMTLKCHSSFCSFSHIALYPITNFNRLHSQIKPLTWPQSLWPLS